MKKKGRRRREEEEEKTRWMAGWKCLLIEFVFRYTCLFMLRAWNLTGFIWFGLEFYEDDVILFSSILHSTQAKGVVVGTSRGGQCNVPDVKYGSKEANT